MTHEDRQLARFSEARRAHHAAVQAHRQAVTELERAGAELVTAGAALAQRVQILETRPTPRRKAA